MALHGLVLVDLLCDWGGEGGGNNDFLFGLGGGCLITEFKHAR